MAKGQAHELGESILSLFTANRVEHQIIMFCLQKELDEKYPDSVFRDKTINNLEHYFRHKFYDLTEKDLSVIKNLKYIFRQIDFKINTEIFELTMRTFENFENKKTIRLEFNEKIKNKIPMSVKNHIFDELSRFFSEKLSNLNFDNSDIEIEHENNKWSSHYLIDFCYYDESEKN